jgi:histidinol-phosphate/aromatic aminotransferase/cobyric acid decarboxylase-like protein
LFVFTHFSRDSLRQLTLDRQEMSAQLATLPGLTVFPSQRNFILVRLRDRLLAEHGVLVRECGNKLGSSSAFLRLVVRPRADVARLMTGLWQVLYGSGRPAG